ncbi:hypothetical protein B7P43_G16842, partial [Cryptotermes secundus]
NRDSIISIATGYGLDDRGFGVRAPVRISPGVKRPGREVAHSSPDSAEVKEM